MPVVNELVSQPIKSVFSPLTGFSQLHNAVSRLQPSLSKSSPNGATCAMLSACCSSGHAAWVADYLHEICGDSSLSSVNLEDMAVMNGDCVESWLLRSTGELINELSVASALANSGLVAKLLGQVVCLRAVNDSLKSLQLSHGGVPSGVHTTASTIPCSVHPKKLTVAAPLQTSSTSATSSFLCWSGCQCMGSTAPLYQTLTTSGSVPRGHYWLSDRLTWRRMPPCRPSKPCCHQTHLLLLHIRSPV